ncbi:MAG: penicillin acylase family protein [Candidatus Kapabacteria bacterium]|jgi:penicillin amidase|nr:penicillin acylase family protein [Candidatus Kapabacteria bacterium]
MKRIISLVIAIVVLGGLVYATSRSWGAIPAFSYFLDVWNGAYRTARTAHESSKAEELRISALSAPVSIYRDERNVPHITAQNDLDAVAALGYLIAKERLFQIDFQTRVASGRLSEIFGADRVKTDQFLRRTGMMLGAERTWEQVQKNAPEVKAVLEAFTSGANAYISSLSPKDYPFEFRLLDYAPEAWSPVKSILVNQLMAFDLTFQGQLDDVVMEEMRQKLGDSAFQELYPNHSVLNVPQSPETQGVVRSVRKETTASLQEPSNAQATNLNLEHRAITALLAARDDAGTLFGETADGKGSNNWVVSGKKTRSQKPLLAGDPHLSLSLPAIWYEVQMITPTMNMYGVTIPGAPLIIVGFNDNLAWSPTNTGADVVDFYTVKFQDNKQQRYFHNGEWKQTEERVQPINVKGGAAVPDTMRFTHWGPIITVEDQALAVRWTAHEPSTILEAIWGMNHARNLAEFGEAHKRWDVPAQNIAFADVEGNIALRSAGHYPIRKRGHGRGVHDGTTDEGAWIGKVPFDSVPGSINPERGWLESANQEPTPADYPYYLNYDWGDIWRSRRIHEYLDGTQNLAWQDFERFQTDVKVMQWEFLKPTISALNLAPKNTAHKQALERLMAWDGIATKENGAALLLHTFIGVLRLQVWDEMLDTAQNLRGNPSDAMIYHLLRNAPDSRWFDRAQTPQRETANDILRSSMYAALDTLTARFGTNPDEWTWGKKHNVIIRHLTRSDALKPLWRGPYPFIGFQSTVVPAGSLMTTHSASWRMVVDFSGGKPVGRAVFPGGPSGNPFSKWYDSQVPTWLDGKLYSLQKAASEAECKQASMRLSTVLMP